MTTIRTAAKRGFAALGAAMLGLVGLVGIAHADGPVAPAWPAEDSTGTIQIQKKGTDQEPLKGVTFSATELGLVSDDGCGTFDFMTQEGWVVVNQKIKDYNTFFTSATTKPGAPNGPTVAQLLAGAGLCEIGTAATLGATDEDGLTTAATVRMGLYLIQETGVGENVITAAAAPFVVAVPYPTFSDDGTVTWNYDVRADAKNIVTTPEEPTKVVDETNVSGNWKPGADVQWTITATVPEATADYESIAITDTTGSTSLTFKSFDSIVISYIDDNDEPATEDLEYTVADGTATLGEASLARVNELAKAGDVTLVARVTTRVAEDYAGGALNNKATLVINGKPGTPGGTDVTVWGVLQINKVDNSTPAKPLTGAEFSVYPATPKADTDPVEFECAAAAPADAITGVKSGDLNTLWIDNGPVGQTAESKAYCVLETKAPVGYVLDSTPKLVDVAADGTTATAYSFVDVPTEGPTLPTTGANGTAMLIIGGVALAAVGGGIALVSRRKAVQ